jgi:protein-tyrosine kinase
MSRIDEALARQRRETQRSDLASVPASGLNSVSSPVASFTDEEEAVPALSSVARVEPHPKHNGQSAAPLIDRVDERVSEKLVIGHTMPQSVEQYRRLGATLHQAQESRGVKTLLIVSAVASEGKTLTASNLALTMSESYRQDTLLIDADLRRPSIDQVFKLSKGAGLLEGLKSPQQRQIAVRRVSEFLSILPAGIPAADPMEALTSDRMQQLVREAARTFDWVIIDTPPVALLPDANLLASLADGALLVVRAGATPYNLVKRAIDALGRERLLGVILNGSDPALMEHSHYFYGYYHRSGGPKS